MEKKKEPIQIEFREGRNYFVRYWRVGIWTGKRKEMEQFHGKLQEINLDKRRLTFIIDENLDEDIKINFKDIITAYPIHSKGERLLEITK